MRIHAAFSLFIVLLLQHALLYAQHHPVTSTAQASDLQTLLDQKAFRGVYLFNPNVDMDTFFSNCQKLGINGVLTNDQLYSNSTFLAKADQYGIHVVLNFPVFFDPAFLEENPQYYGVDSHGDTTINSWLHFACPSQPAFLEHRKEMLKHWLELVHPKMVSLDFIRFYVFWEKVYPQSNLEDIVDGCYCAHCIRAFEAATEISLDDSSPEWIRSHALQEWADWKCGVIEQAVQALAEVVKNYDPNILIALKVVPWRERDFNGAIRSVAGQDVKRLSKYVDVFMPMTYAHMVKRKPDWINEVMSDIHAKTGKQVLANIQIEKMYIDEEISEEEYSDMVHYGSMSPSSGYVLFHYDFIPHTEKKELRP